MATIKLHPRGEARWTLVAVADGARQERIEAKFRRPADAITFAKSIQSRYGPPTILHVR
jgi:hypothetical protein